MLGRTSVKVERRSGGTTLLVAVAAGTTSTCSWLPRRRVGCACFVRFPTLTIPSSLGTEQNLPRLLPGTLKSGVPLHPCSMQHVCRQSPTMCSPMCTELNYPRKAFCTAICTHPGCMQRMPCMLLAITTIFSLPCWCLPPPSQPQWAPTCTVAHTPRPKSGTRVSWVTGHGDG